MCELFETSLPNFETDRDWEVTRPKYGIREEWMMPVGFGLIGRVHWNGERSVLCTRSADCHACHLLGPPRVESWHYVINYQHRWRILTLPRGATEQLKLIEADRGALRGAVIQTKREQSHKGPVSVAWCREASVPPRFMDCQLRPLAQVLKSLFAV